MSSDAELLLLQALADPARLTILRSLVADGPACARDLGDRGGGRAQSTISHHLRVLREAGWIRAERRGTWIWYSIRPEAQQRFEQLARSVGSQALRTETTAASTPRQSQAPSAPRTVRPAWREW
jgi:ArsR family transcriptional regulator, arsenate/arsenite/antimonite-responsive transcriptional repressor